MSHVAASARVGFAHSFPAPSPYLFSRPYHLGHRGSCAPPRSYFRTPGPPRRLREVFLVSGEHGRSCSLHAPVRPLARRRLLIREHPRDGLRRRQPRQPPSRPDGSPRSPPLPEAARCLPVWRSRHWTVSMRRGPSSVGKRGEADLAPHPGERRPPFRIRRRRTLPLGVRDPPSLVEPVADLLVREARISPRPRTFFRLLHSPEAHRARILRIHVSPQQILGNAQAGASPERHAPLARPLLVRRPQPVLGETSFEPEACRLHGRRFIPLGRKPPQCGTLLQRPGFEPPVTVRLDRRRVLRVDVDPELHGLRANRGEPPPREETGRTGTGRTRISPRPARRARRGGR